MSQKSENEPMTSEEKLEADSSEETSEADERDTMASADSAATSSSDEVDETSTPDEKSNADEGRNSKESDGDSESSDTAVSKESNESRAPAAKESTPSKGVDNTDAQLNDPMMPLVGFGIVAGATVGFFVAGGPGLILVLAGSALLSSIWMMWISLQQIGSKDDMGFEEALSLAAPSATEEQKQAVLRALKDLEYERHVGKISEADFKQVSSEYRQKAKQLIAVSDEDMKDRMDAAQQRVEKHLKQAKQSSSTENGSPA